MKVTTFVNTAELFHLASRQFIGGHFFSSGRSVTRTVPSCRSLLRFIEEQGAGIFSRFALADCGKC
ncbi:hypothetical protein, partial [Rhizobium sp. J15]|uniref:hypothetical protein n=1 Tax=Rhizobium sp. J15 TaxID=2035450 RepID=UPI001AECECE0